MAGNDKGGPWGGSSGGDNRGGNNGDRPPGGDGPQIPEIEEIVKKGQEQLRVLMGGRGGSGGSGSGGELPSLGRGTIGLVVLATIPAVIVGGLFKDRVEALFENPVAPGIALLVTGAFLWTSRGALQRATKERPVATAALLIGLAQAFALIPGISRSGATVVTALWLGIQAKEAAAFSFLMAVPAIAGAMVLMIPDLGAGVGPGMVPLALGGLAAAVTGVLAIKTFVAMLDRKSFYWFAPYCWSVGVLYLVYLAVRVTA